MCPTLVSFATLCLPGRVAAATQLQISTEPHVLGLVVQQRPTLSHKSVPLVASVHCEPDENCAPSPYMFTGRKEGTGHSQTAQPELLINWDSVSLSCFPNAPNPLTVSGFSDLSKSGESQLHLC